MSDSDPIVHEEKHRSHRTGWLRAAVLGANDGIVSTASLIIGVAAANTSREGVLLAGIAGLVAGAMSMAAGEYVSVSSQADTEKADLKIEQASIRSHFELETEELALIYEVRGLDPELAREVAEQLMTHDALAAHARDEIGISETVQPRPVQAAFNSAVTFGVGASLPLAVAMLAPIHLIILFVALATVCSLALLGLLAAGAGGAPLGTGAMRVMLWGVLAMLVTAAIGRLFGVVV